VVLDGVFNHTGRGFFAFEDVLDNGAESRYKNWYYIHRFPVDAFGGGKSTTYEAWWDIKDLPKLNTTNPDVRKFLIEVSRYWIEQGTDGWRLDVPNEIDDDAFWAEWRSVVKAANPDAYTVGEIWDGDPRWVGDNHFDGLMHYTLRDAILGLLEKEIKLAEFVKKMEGFLTEYERENVFSMYLAMGSHDTRRLITRMDNDLNKVRLVFLLQFANPGAPAIYYGDEIGLPGEGDPDNRRAFPWDDANWNHELRTYVQKLIAGRKRHAALRRGDLERIHFSKTNGWYAFSRVLGEDKAVTVINPGKETKVMNVPLKKLNLPDGTLFEDIVSGGRYRLTDQAIQVTLGPWSGVILATMGRYE
jgi:neopullulanase